MKKILTASLIISSVLLFTGCDKIESFIKNNSINPTKQEETKDSTQKPEQTSSETKQSNETSPYTIKDYYPFMENIVYEYEGTGNEYASYKVWIDFIKGDKIQRRTNNGGTELVSVLQNKAGELKVVFSKEEAYYREDFTSKQSNKDEILLKEPLVKGTSWTLPDGRKRYISNVDVSMKTPLGDFKALEVTTEDKDSKIIDYYGLNAGLIESVYQSSGMDVKSTLTKLSRNTPLTQTVRFYYPNGNENKLYYTDKKLSFKTNDLTKMIFEKQFKEAPNKTLGKLIGPNVKIKVLYLNKDTVYVDFSKELITEMNAGSDYEGLILQAITNTLGKYYGVDRVYITVEDKPYTSGHIEMKKGETFKVATDKAVKLK